MHDQAYRRDQIPMYGAGPAQLAVAERSATSLRMTRIGTALAAVAVLTGLAAVLTYPDMYGDFAGRGFAIAAFVSSVLLLGICILQHGCWLRATAVWQGRADADLGSLCRLSFAAHVASYVVAAVVLGSSIVAIVIASFLATASILLVVSLLLVLAAQILAGVQYVRVSGPPGTLPAHMRKAIASQQPRRG